MLKKITKGNNPKATAQFGKTKQQQFGANKSLNQGGGHKRINAQRRSGAK